LRPGEIRSEQEQHLTVEDGMVAGASADDPRHAHIVGIVVFEEVLAARRMGHRRLQPRRRGDDLVVRASATRAGVDGDRFALVENGRDRIEVFVVWANERTSLNDLANTPVSAATLGAGNVVVPGLLSNVATFKRTAVPTNANQTNIQPVYEVYASVQGRDLGSVAADIDKVVTEMQKQLKPGNTIQVVGQIQSMNDAFRDLGIGLLFAAVLVYLLMVVNYQNFGDPFVVILALPATLCGILVMLYVTGTTINVPSLMGAIMAVGVASANSILLVTFAREQQLTGRSSIEAAIAAGHTRIRPVLMTAAAMIVGMIPMAIGGAGEEQNAALARAVIGGLLFATPTTLLVVPYLFALLRKGNDGKSVHGVFAENEST
jgi:multidrug efflux pump subunit AcrB